MADGTRELLFGGVGASELIEEFGSPLYVYEEDIIRARYEDLRSAITYPKTRIHYAAKANSNPAILALLQEMGAGIDATSPGEVYLALGAGFAPSEVIFTGVNSSADDLAYCHEQGVQVNIGSPALLEYWGETYPGTQVSIRVNPDVGAGHHDHTITGGPRSKFGIYYDRMDRAQEIADRYDVDIVGVHAHIGSGILETSSFLTAMDIILDTAAALDGLEFIDIGGGMGVPYRPEDTPLPLTEMGHAMSEKFSSFCADYGSSLELKLEPGRYLVAEAGTLLTRVTNLKATRTYRFVGVDTGFNHLARPILYGSYHHIDNATNPEAIEEKVVVGGNLCESGDVFTRGDHGIEERMVPSPRMGDILALREAGAYGYSMASNYNSRLLPAEVVVSDGMARLIRRRQTLEDLTWADV
jgi:diaminopimelate decarboxylase